MKEVGIDNCFISEITLAELKFGAANSNRPEKHDLEIKELLKKVSVIPIISSLDIFALEKTRLRKAGTPVDDFDLLIGASAIVNNMVLVTNNLKHFERLENIQIEDWAN